MTKEEILDYNKRCAEFLGYKGEPKYIYTDNGKGYNGFIYHIPIDLIKQGTGITGLLKTDRSLKYHSDWNWIMEVIKSIGKLPFDEIKGLKEYMDNNFQIHIFIEKEEVVQSINDFLIWYKTNSTINN